MKHHLMAATAAILLLGGTAQAADTGPITIGVPVGQAYMLCSLAGQLRVTQIVDGNKGIHMLFPKACL